MLLKTNVLRLTWLSNAGHLSIPSIKTRGGFSRISSVQPSARSQVFRKSELEGLIRHSDWNLGLHGVPQKVPSARHVSQLSAEYHMVEFEGSDS